MSASRGAAWMEKCRSLLHRWSPGVDGNSKNNVLEAQHRRGQFDFLYSIEEIGHYMIIAGYLPYLHPAPDILDVGCGQGRLFELLQRTSDYRRYVGIDISAAAISRATKTLRDQRATFVTADFEAWQTDDRFNVIIFNETLYYAERARETLVRYARFLQQGGAMVISIHEHMGFERLWHDIPAGFKLRASDTVQNRRGQIWEVRAFQPCAL